ncbi:fumarylacetoacetate hydrolase family protein [Clostridium sp. C2-6-12]|uniref:fumarylacetoacetate hydrolase family protein n=1 Tax=Clostridium sp. C2-6-12 TaxID=2698832 RepID=UPI0013709353|nr:fumarylacetoacetate hydrolase family protein [Clostridium sp. C2-6-12]
MKLLTFKHNNKEEIGILTKDEQGIYPIKNYNCMNDLIENITDKEMDLLRSAVESGSKEIISTETVTIMAPIPNPKQDVICLGINYMAHAVESARYKKEAFDGDRPYAVYFSKRVNVATADGDFIPSYADIVDSLDYEAELAVIIKKDAKNVAKEDAYDYIFGYTIMNDVSARNLQTRHKQWYFGKSLDGFTPMGPCIVTKDQFSNPPVLKICSRVNGELRQNSTTDLMITSIEDVIHELSQGVTLKAGTIIAMGTPAGVGMGFDPPKFLKAGDIVECEIEGIGILKNIVK